MNPHAATDRRHSKHPWQHPWGRALAGLLLASAVAAQTETTPSRRRGQYLRTEVLRTDVEKTYSCTLAPTSGSTLMLLFRRQERLRHHEVRIYEVVLEERTTDAETGREGLSYRVSPGDEMRGETSVRETTRDLGAFGNASFAIDGTPVKTDAAGLFADTEQAVLKRFDDLGTNAIDMVVSHEALGSQTVRISRYLTLRWEGKAADERQRLMQTDLLVALGVDYEPLTPVDRSGLKVKVVLPDTLVPGEDILIRLTAVNEGRKPVSCLLGRLFSRQPWFNGVNFYLGNLPPNASREFTRVLHVPDSATPGPVFGAVGMWDILGPLTEGAMPVTARVSGRAAAPAER